MFGGRGGGGLWSTFIWHNIPVYGPRGLNYLKLLKIIMGGIIYWTYQGKGDMSDGNVWGLFG